MRTVLFHARAELWPPACPLEQGCAGQPQANRSSKRSMPRGSFCCTPEVRNSLTPPQPEPENRVRAEQETEPSEEITAAGDAARPSCPGLLSPSQAMTLALHTRQPQTAACTRLQRADSHTCCSVLSLCGASTSPPTTHAAKSLCFSHRRQD